MVYTSRRHAWFQTKCACLSIYACVLTLYTLELPPDPSKLITKYGLLLTMKISSFCFAPLPALPFFLLLLRGVFVAAAAAPVALASPSLPFAVVAVEDDTFLFTGVDIGLILGGATGVEAAAVDDDCADKLLDLGLEKLFFCGSVVCVFALALLAVFACALILPAGDALSSILASEDDGNANGVETETGEDLLVLLLLVDGNEGFCAMMTAGRCERERGVIIGLTPDTDDDADDREGREGVEMFICTGLRSLLSFTLPLLLLLC